MSDAPLDHLVLLRGAVRRMQAAPAEVDPVAPVPAADGADEVFELFLPRMLQRGFPAAVTIEGDERAAAGFLAGRITP